MFETGIQKGISRSSPPDWFRKAHNLALPVTPSEQIESTHAAFEAGARLVHIHVRNPDESPSSYPELFRQVQLGVREHCPDMASLSTGSVNFPTIVHENSAVLATDLASMMRDHAILPETEVFDLSHLYPCQGFWGDVGLATADNVLSMLGLFTMDAPEWTVEAAMLELGLSSSTAYDCFRSLVSAGLLVAGKSGRYGVGGGATSSACYAGATVPG